VENLSSETFSFFQEIKATTLTKYFKLINLMFKSVYFYCTDPVKKWR